MYRPLNPLLKVIFKNGETLINNYFLSTTRTPTRDNIQSFITSLKKSQSQNRYQSTDHYYSYCLLSICEFMLAFPTRINRFPYENTNTWLYYSLLFTITFYSFNKAMLRDMDFVSAEGKPGTIEQLLHLLQTQIDHYFLNFSIYPSVFKEMLSMLSLTKENFRIQLAGKRPLLSPASIQTLPNSLNLESSIGELILPQYTDLATLCGGCHEYFYNFFLPDGGDGEGATKRLHCGHILHASCFNLDSMILCPVCSSPITHAQALIDRARVARTSRSLWASTRQGFAQIRIALLMMPLSPMPLASSSSQS